jgi:protein-S-isoprenylcysteine O-methyltransferase Ste14
MVGPLLTFLAMVAYGILHSLLASNRVKQLAERRFGAAGNRFYRIIYNLLGGVTFLPVLAITAAYPGVQLYSIPFPWIVLSTIGQVLAVGLLLAGLQQTDPWRFLGLRQLLEGESSPTAGLTRSGVYRHVRHPLYSAGLLFIWLTPLMTTSILALNIGISLYLYIGSTFEERRLEREFGPAYVEYRNQVPRLIPCFRPRPGM